MRKIITLFVFLVAASMLLCAFDAPPGNDNPNAGLMYATDPAAPNALPPPEKLVISIYVYDEAMSDKERMMKGDFISVAVAPMYSNGKFASMQPVDFQICKIKEKGANSGGAGCSVYMYAPSLIDPAMHYSLIVNPLFSKTHSSKVENKHQITNIPWANYMEQMFYKNQLGGYQWQGGQFVNNDIYKYELAYDEDGNIHDYGMAGNYATHVPNAYNVWLNGFDKAIEIEETTGRVTYMRPTPIISTATPATTKTPTATPTATATPTPLPFAEKAIIAASTKGGVLVIGLFSGALLSAFFWLIIRLALKRKPETS